MNKKSIVPVLLALLLLLALPAFGMAEEGLGSAAADGLPATPTDLACAHEHTETTNYFYDSPSYYAMDAETHRVSGYARVETRCLDCGEILNVQDNAYTEEVRPHTFKNNVCALCGFRFRVKETEAPVETTPAASPETTVYASGSGTGYQTMTLTNAELRELESTGVVTLLVRGSQKGKAAVALNVHRMHAQTQTSGMDLRLDMAEREDGSFFAGLSLERDGKEQAMMDRSGVTLRFYQAKTPALKVSLSPSATDDLVEAETAWNDKGYWTVPYQAEGTYFPKQQ